MKKETSNHNKRPSSMMDVYTVIVSNKKERTSKIHDFKLLYNTPIN